MSLKELIRNVPDFPKQGIQFKLHQIVCKAGTSAGPRMVSVASRGDGSTLVLTVIILPDQREDSISSISSKTMSMTAFFINFKEIGGMAPVVVFR